MGATCPVPDCGYGGAPASVEAHISGSTTGGHSGVLGEQMRDQLSSGVPWAKLAVVGGVLLALYLAQDGGSAEQGEEGEEEAETFLVDPAEPALVQEGVE